MNNSESLLPAERQSRILEILAREFTVRSSTLSEMFGVSEMTIRRDFDLLEQRGVVERTHGGAVYKQERLAGKFKYQNSIKENLNEKKQIAQKAATLIEPNDVVYLGEGTTTALVLRYVEPGLPCTIFTNNLGVTTEISAPLAAEIVFLGGTYNPTTHALAGPLTMEMIPTVNANKVLLGADALSINKGLTTLNFEMAVIERNMIKQTQGQVIVMANHTKFGLVAQMEVVPLKQIDVLVTNCRLPNDFQKKLESLKVEVLIT